jgi:hypothetical protein
MLCIRTEQSSKNWDSWRVPLRDDPVAFLRQGLDERATYDKYADSDRVC